ncbi:heme-binding protein [Mycolicibacterium sp.]|uniref:heme-binding protein n=1 Tax=Mycolicibacterium sp. TaxID=2320850 RepID=UPI0025D3F191|nr:heme-binding protein [Mycolicibacterium sp.]
MKDFARPLAAALGTVGAAALVCWCPTVSADPGGAERPNCTGADFAVVSAGVATAMSTYLFTHPDVNAFVTGLESEADGQSTMKLVEYYATHPDVKAATEAIRAPLADFDQRCGYGRAAESTRA